MQALSLKASAAPVANRSPGSAAGFQRNGRERLLYARHRGGADAQAECRLAQGAKRPSQ
jgi:hypothetical protein